MSKPKHTPGPWRLKRATYFPERNQINEYCWVGYGPIGDETPVWGRSILENEANCRLIAAAPEMLDWIKAIVMEQEAMGGYGDASTISSGRKLIAKAEGNEE